MFIAKFKEQSGCVSLVIAQSFDLLCKLKRFFPSTFILHPTGLNKKNKTILSGDKYILRWWDSCLTLDRMSGTRTPAKFLLTPCWGRRAVEWLRVIPVILLPFLLIHRYWKEDPMKFTLNLIPSGVIKIQQSWTTIYIHFQA